MRQISVKDPRLSSLEKKTYIISLIKSHIVSIIVDIFKFLLV